MGSPRFIRSAADVVRECGRGVLSVVYAQQTVGEISVVSVIKGWPLRGGNEFESSCGKLCSILYLQLDN